jgi:hypothetical protein
VNNGLLRKQTIWVPEIFIRAVNQSPTLNYAKVYDAVARVRLRRHRRGGLRHRI